MTDACVECEADISPRSVCRDHFHRLLAIETDYAAGVGERTHLLAVSSYVLQHPNSTTYSNDGLRALRIAVGEILFEYTSIETVRTSLRAAFDGERRVRASEDERVDEWHRQDWPMTVVDVIADEPSLDTYRRRVDRWATSVAETISE